MKRYIVLFIFWNSFISGFTQNLEIDSLQRQIAQIRALPLDTAQVRQLSFLGYDIIDVDSTLSKNLLEEAVQKSLKLKNNEAISNSYRMLGLWYYNFNDNKKALESQRNSLEAAKKNKHLYLMAGAYFNIGNIKYSQGEYDSCVTYYLKAQEIFDNPKIYEDKTLTKKVLDKKISDLYYNMSTAFNTLKNLPKADEYIEKALAIANSYHAQKVIAFYAQQKADNYYENGEIKKALQIRLKYLHELEISDVPKTHIQGYYQNISQEYFELQQIDSSLYYAKKSLSLSEEINIEDGIANSQLLLAKIALKEKHYTEADKNLKACTAYFEKSEDPTEKRGYYQIMHRFMSAIGKFKEAYFYFEKYTDINDTIMSGERATQFSELEAKYQSEKKDNQIKIQQANLKRKKLLNIILGIFLATFLLVGFLMYSNYKHKQTIQTQRINELETEKQLTAAEAVLKGEEQERSRLAKDLHDGLGGMLSGIKYSLNNMKGNLIMTPENATAFERSLDMLDSSIKEMRRVAHNMMPEALVKFGLDTALRDFCSDINQSGKINITYQSYGLENKEIEQNQSITLYRIVQELVNNALKHSGANEMLVQLSHTDSKLSITVEDNGKGFDTQILDEMRGMGWSNIQSRVDFLKGTLDVHSDKNSGTSILIEVEI